MVGLVSMENGIAMDDTNVFSENVVDEYNGIYCGKWHIVSPEGYLPEGLEYLKNSWEGSIEEENLLQ